MRNNLTTERAEPLTLPRQVAEESGCKGVGRSNDSTAPARLDAAPADVKAIPFHGVTSLTRFLHFLVRVRPLYPRYSEFRNELELIINSISMV